MAGAVGVGPGAVGPLGVDPGPGGLRIGVGVGAGGAALVLQLPQALALGARQEPARRGRVDRGGAGDRLGLLHRDLPGGGRLGDLWDELQVASALQLLGRLRPGGAGGAGQPVLRAAVAIAAPHRRLGDLGRRHRLHRAPGALDPLTERHQLPMRWPATSTPDRSPPPPPRAVERPPEPGERPAPASRTNPTKGV